MNLNVVTAMLLKTNFTTNINYRCRKGITSGLYSCQMALYGLEWKMVVFISIKESIERIEDNHIWLANLKGGFDNTTQSYCAELFS